MIQKMSLEKHFAKMWTKFNGIREESKCELLWTQ